MNIKIHHDEWHLFWVWKGGSVLENQQCSTPYKQIKKRKAWYQLTQKSIWQSSIFVHGLKTLSALRMEENFLNIIKKKSRANFMLNDEKINDSSPELGTEQGSLLLALLFT